MEPLFDPTLVFSSRLAIVACLANGDPMSFTELSKATGLADGNLHVQTRKLEEGGYISISAARTGGRGRGRTVFRITETGERRLRHLIAALEQSLERRPLGGRPGSARPPGKDDERVW
jgi:predicted ArsR family transcriptional regulator